MMISKRLASSFLSSFKFSSTAEAPGLQIGDILRLTRVFKSADVVDYSKVSYDSNPLHFDTQCAQNAGFQDRIVHGMLVASLFPRIISSHFPGAVYVSQSLQFKQPVYVGEEIIGEVQAINVREFKKKHLVKFSTRCFKNGDILVLDGEATAILPTILMELQGSKE